MKNQRDVVSAARRSGAEAWGRRIGACGAAVIAVVGLAACGSGTAARTVASAPVPPAFDRAATVADAQLRVEVMVDGGTPDEVIAELSNPSFQGNNLIRGSVDLSLAPGPHTFELLYYLERGDGTSVLVARSPQREQTLRAGEAAAVDFTELELILPDADGDGVPSLAELESGSDPDDPESTPATGDAADGAGGESPPPAGGAADLPGPPQNVTALSVPGNIQVSWEAQPDMRYVIYAASQAGVTSANISQLQNGQRLADVQPPFTFPGAPPPGVPYYIVVTAVTGAGEGPPSPEVSAAAGETGPQQDVTAPVVTGTTPKDGTGLVSVVDPLRVAFDEPVQLVAADGVTLSAAGAGTVAVDVQVANNELVITPAAPLSLGRGYTASVAASAVVDGAGNGLGAAVEWGFTTRDGQWTPAEPLGSDASHAPAVAVTGEGDPVVAWVDRQGLWVRQRQAGGWSEPQLLFAGEGSIIGGPPQLVHAGDVTVAAWVVSGGDSQRGVWSSVYRLADGWSEPVRVAASGALARHLALAGNRGGHVLAAWSDPEGVGGMGRVRYARFVQGSGWTAVGQLAPAGILPVPALQEDGSGAAVWVSDGFLVSRFMDKSGQWSELQPVSHQADDMTVGLGRIVSFGSGDYLAVWSEYASGQPTIRVRRYGRLGDGAPRWLDNQVLARGGGVGLPQLGSGGGTGMAVWLGNEGGGPRLWSATYQVDGGWSSPAVVSSDPVAGGSVPALAMDRFGRAIAAWGDAKSGLVVGRYAEGSWTQSAVEGRKEVAQPVAAVSPDGRAAVVWHGGKGPKDLQVNAVRFQ